MIERIYRIEVVKEFQRLLFLGFMKLIRFVGDAVMARFRKDELDLQVTDRHLKKKKDDFS